jgi:hypothetical protein
VAKYKAKFDEHTDLTGWSRNNLRSHFYDGLSDAIKDALAISDHPTEAYDLLVEAAQVLDIHLHQHQAEKKGQTFYQTTQQTRGTKNVPMDINAICQGGRQQGKGHQDSKPSYSTFLQNMKGKCFSCRSKDHSKADGNHDHKVCHHCKKTGHHSMVCFAKYMGKEKATSTS